MNDIKRPGSLPPPQPHAPVSLKGVKPVPTDIKPKNTKVETQPSVARPLSLPPPSGLRIDKPKKRRWLTWTIVITSVILLFVVIASVAGYLWYADALTPYSKTTERVRLVVKDGQTADQVATELEQKHIIKSAFALQIYIKLNAKSSVKAGTYVFSPSQTPAEIMQWINDGRVDTLKVTILPGQTLTELKKALHNDYGYSNDAIDAAFAKQYTHALFADKPAGTSLEGYIFPETYFVTSDTTVEQLLVITFDEFEKQITKNNLRATLAQRGFSLFEAITLASIVEKEVTSQTDRRQVAQVFETRLEEGMTLGSDVTYHYGAELLGVEPTPDLDSPYNTRIHGGLPPGPIANFDIGVLQAVADPAPGDYLFFVAGDDGVTHFAKTDSEHEANISQYCKKLCASN